MFCMAFAHMDQDSHSFHDSTLPFRAAIDLSVTESRLCVLTGRKPTEKEKQKKRVARAPGLSPSTVLNSFRTQICMYRHKAHGGFKMVNKESIYPFLEMCSRARQRMRSEDLSSDALQYFPN